MRGQPTYDSDHSRGKIVCFDLQTYNFWCTYIPIATLNVGEVSCRAWSWEEYEVPKIRYSCLIPLDTCKGLEVRDLIHATLVLINLSMDDVLTYRTSYTKLSNQRICNIEVTDQLANSMDNAGRLFRGPVCSLSCLQQTKMTYPLGVQIFFITEPPTICVSNKLSNVPGDTYNVFAEKKWRAAIITTGIISWCCPQYCASDIIVCQTKINDRLTYLVSMYMDGKKHEFPSEFIQLIANKGECDILVTLDSNSHSTVWNCPRTDRRGELVEDFLITNNLQCVNVGIDKIFAVVQVTH